MAYSKTVKQLGNLGRFRWTYCTFLQWVLPGLFLMPAYYYFVTSGWTINRLVLLRGNLISRLTPQTKLATTLLNVLPICVDILHILRQNSPD
jgi:hypothetical protein